MSSHHPGKHVTRIGRSARGSGPNPLEQTQALDAFGGCSDSHDLTDSSCEVWPARSVPSTVGVEQQYCTSSLFAKRKTR